MGCVQGKPLQQNIFFTKIDSQFNAPPNDELVLSGYFNIQVLNQTKSQKLFCKFYKLGKITFQHNQDTFPDYYMNINGLEFIPELRIHKEQKNLQNSSNNNNNNNHNTALSNLSTQHNVNTITPMRKLQIQKIEKNYENSNVSNHGSNLNLSNNNPPQNNLDCIQVKLIKNEQFLIFKSDTDLLNELRQYLNCRIIQKGFQYQYKIIKKLGQGGFASVFLVGKRENNEKFAVKIFSKQQLQKEKDGIQGLQNEIKIMRALKHVNLLKVHEIFSSDNSIYMIMDLHQGGTLDEKIKNKENISSKGIKQITRQLLYGIEEMHKKRIMHRDIKPENIIFKYNIPGNYHCVLADFGLATKIDIPKYLYTKCGTPGFVAPEVWQYTEQNKYNEQCDVFSIGIIFHILLLGYSPFDDKNLQICIKKNKNATINWKSDEYKLLKQDSLDLLKQLLEVDPNKRISINKAINHPYFNSNVPIDYYQEPLPSNLLKQTLKLKLNTEEIENSECSTPKAYSAFKSPQLQYSQIKQQIKDNSSDYMHMNSPVYKGRDILKASEESQGISPYPHNLQNSQAFFGSQYVTPNSPMSSGRHSKFGPQNNNEQRLSGNKFVFPASQFQQNSNQNSNNNNNIHNNSGRIEKSNSQFFNMARDYVDENLSNQQNYQNLSKYSPEVGTPSSVIKSRRSKSRHNKNVSPMSTDRNNLLFSETIQIQNRNQ
ncbi:Protein kinase-like domain [Pseudocohnilembus persalinus]|uniref:Protein kinase-like domain n=1 Tax=Pseudocohnilembus persalinus TaxID=266149 RepID=A0A0V0QDM1_PSEPJ|nr:Protein kinase-like domain [Pseudocohnilembus persalinus]|eukprot:KRX00308.1 Protein kinase-like domain [Pseudocohnilembus persalinus]